ncbi:MAG: glycogen debranching enzyme N-terminal domain-containing protein, partial [Planctomycetota bacterium]
MTATDNEAGSPMKRSASGARDREREWLLTDGLGGYACGTAVDLPTRRYHCWLTVGEATGRRRRLLASCEERIEDESGEHVLAAAHWASFAEPSVPSIAREFASDPVPTAIVRTETGAVLERCLVLTRGRPQLFVRWRNVGKVAFRLRVRPLLAGEDADALLRERAVHPVSGAGDALVLAIDASSPPLFVSTSGNVTYAADPCWYRDYHFAIDRDRGYDSIADRYAPGVLAAELAPGEEITVAFAVSAPVHDAQRGFAAAIAERTQRLRWAARAPSLLAQRLRRGVDDFFYRDAQGRLGVLAGFPWFGEWGRDVFVSLPGLTLAVDEPERGLEVLRGAVPFLRDGLLPNIYGPDVARSHYGSADAALWFSICVQCFAEEARDEGAVRDEFGPVLQQIAEAYTKGTELGLAVDADGLLRAGSPDRNAT